MRFDQWFYWQQVFYTYSAIFNISLLLLLTGVLLTIRRRNDELPVATKSSVCDVATTTGYNGLPSFKFVSSPCESYERQRAFNIVASNLHRPSEVLQQLLDYFNSK